MDGIFFSHQTFKRKQKSKYFKQQNHTRNTLPDLIINSTLKTIKNV